MMLETAKYLRGKTQTIDLAVVVAIGAAVHGFNLHAEGDSTLLLDVTPLYSFFRTAHVHWNVCQLATALTNCSNCLSSICARFSSSCCALRSDFGSKRGVEGSRAGTQYISDRGIQFDFRTRAQIERVGHKMTVQERPASGGGELSVPHRTSCRTASRPQH